MRFSTIVSLLLAIILASAAAYGARDWLSEQQQRAFELASTQLQTNDSAEVAERPRNYIVVAAEPIGFGELLKPSNLREIEWSGSVLPQGSFSAINEVVVGETDDLARFALAEIAPGEPVLNSKVTAPGQRAKLSTALTPGKKAVSIRVNDVLGVAGFVLPGDRVDIMLTRGGFVDVLLQGVRVLAIDQLADQRTENPSVVRTVTFEVSTEEAQKLVLGSTVGTLSLALRNISSAEIETIERITIEDLADPRVTEELFEDALKEAGATEDGESDRISELEALLKNINEGVSDKLNTLEQKLNQTETANDGVVDPASILRPALIDSRATVGVIRNGQKQEYKVDAASEKTSDQSDDN